MNRPSCCSALNHLQLSNVELSEGIPDYTGEFHDKTNTSLVAGDLCLSRTLLQIRLQKCSGIAHLFGYRCCLCIPAEVVLESYSHAAT